MQPSLQVKACVVALHHRGHHGDAADQLVAQLCLHPEIQLPMEICGLKPAVHWHHRYDPDDSVARFCAVMPDLQKFSSQSVLPMNLALSMLRSGQVSDHDGSWSEALYESPDSAVCPDDSADADPEDDHRDGLADADLVDDRQDGPVGAHRDGPVDD